MAVVDFTLDDIRTVVREEAGQVFEEKFGPAFEAAFDPYALAIQQDLAQLKTDLAGVKADIKGLNRVVGQHSRDIMDLRSRLA